jgi:hypothetical protein
LLYLAIDFLIRCESIRAYIPLAISQPKSSFADLRPLITHSTTDSAPRH